MNIFLNTAFGTNNFPINYVTSNNPNYINKNSNYQNPNNNYNNYYQTSKNIGNEVFNKFKIKYQILEQEVLYQLDEYL